MKDSSSRRDLLVVFGSVQRVMQAEKSARARSLDVDVIPAPRSVSSECGVVLEARAGEAARLEEALEEGGLSPASVYRLENETWMLSSLDAQPSRAALARGAAYGGCGAKLAKGLLDSILCGLPRIESKDLIVGIETADDAGVMRVSDEIGIIHTTDFFPPMVDDAFSFGRIAAANALSDVYAMGGRPLAGMNLVSFPLQSYDKSVLKEILRGGLSALEEAGAALAGGHTIEGQELLYGLAVTGTVHPEQIWRNEGARPGDHLVLTKALGTGVVTTAAKAEMVNSDHLTTCVRSMATLNRHAAEAAREARPHAVTDVTGFGLSGHAAEIADASGVTIHLELASLPLLPGAREAATTGFVPAGTGKNRESLASSMEIAEGSDPILVDLALDPQTSGGLLVACAPEDAARMARRLSGSARIVGRCESRGEASIRLA